MRRLVVFALLCASSAWADRVVLRAFTGKGAAAARAQLDAALCARVECVPEKAVLKGRALDPKKLRAQRVTLVVGGDVKAKGRAKSLTLTIEPVGKGKQRHVAVLSRAGRLSDPELTQALLAVRELGGLDAPSEASSAPAVAPPPKAPAARAEPDDAPAVASPPPMRFDAPPPLPETVRRPIDAAPARPEPTPKRAASRRYPVVVGELGVAVLHRRFEYQRLATNNLRNYELPVFPLGLLQVSFAPLALLRQDALAGLALHLDYGTSPFLVTRLVTGGEAYPTAIHRLQAGVQWRLAPFDGLPLALLPFVGMHLASFSVRAAGNGDRIVGLPNPEFIGLGLGLGVEVPVAAGLVTILGSVGLNPYFGGGELISAAYFPNGRALGLDVRAGAAVRVFGPLSVLVRFDLASAFATFATGEADPYVADGAVDLSVGGSLAARVAF